MKKQSPKPERKKNQEPVTNKRTELRFSLLIAVFSFLIYSNTLHNGYVLDDTSIIKENKMTQGGTSSLKEIFRSAYRAGNLNSEKDLYRPLSKAMFAVEWQISPNNPFIHHFINVLLYAIVCSLLFIVMLRWTTLNPWIIFITAMLFAAHPIHTEVVANIKSRDEILTMLFVLLALMGLRKYCNTRKIISLIASLLCFFLALLSKESAIVFVAIVPLFIYFFTDQPTKQYIMTTIYFAAIAILYLILHKSVIGSIGLKNIPVIDNTLLSTSNVLWQKATAVLIMGKYLLLLLFPHPLSCDYSYSTIPVIGPGNLGFLLAFAVHVYLLVFAIKKFKEKNILSFCILFYLVSMSIASNIFMLIGTHMAERLLFLPSLAFCLALVYLLSKLFKIDPAIISAKFNDVFSKGKAMAVITVVILLLFTGKTFSRNKDWKDNGTLFKTDLEKVPNSAHMLMYYTDYLINKEALAKLSPDAKKARLELARGYITKALKIYELFPDAHYLYGRISYELNDHNTAFTEYHRALTLNPGKAMYHNNAGTALFALGRYAEAATEFETAMKIDPTDADPPFNLGSAYGSMGEVYKQKNDKDNAMKMFNLAVPNFQKAIQLNPKYKSAYQFLGMTYNSMGDTTNGKIYIEKAAQIKQ